MFLHQGRIEEQGRRRIFGTPRPERFRQFLAGSRREHGRAPAPEPA